jgi:hypothetical protein
MWVLLEGRPEMDGSPCGLIKRIPNTPSAYRNRKRRVKDATRTGKKIFVVGQKWDKADASRLGCSDYPDFGGLGSARYAPNSDTAAKWDKAVSRGCLNFW